MIKLRGLALATGLVVAPLMAAAQMSPVARHIPPSAWKKQNVVKVAPPARGNRAGLYVRDWKESDAPKCITSSQLVGLMLNKRDAIDLVLRDRKVVRAKLKKGCASVEFYSGLYMKPTKDGRICEGRDMIYSPTGGSCLVKKVNTLTPPK